MRRTLHIALLLLLLIPALHAQDEEGSRQGDNSEEGIPQIDATKIEAVDDTIDTKSPMGAVLRSAIIPGWGQFYNESYWKVPIVLGLSGWLIYGMVQEHQDYVYYRDLYEGSITENDPTGNLQYKRYREFYRDNRDTYGWWLLVTYLLQLADAYVDAALFNFDVSETASITLVPRPNGAAFQLRF